MMSERVGREKGECGNSIMISYSLTWTDYIPYLRFVERSVTTRVGGLDEMRAASFSFSFFFFKSPCLI